MKNVDRIRQYLANRTLPSLRVYVSQLEGSQDQVALLRDPIVQAGIIESVMEALGHATQVTADSKEARSHARRAVAKGAV